MSWLLPSVALSRYTEEKIMKEGKIPEDEM
jgi:hypothetical protein